MPTNAPSKKGFIIWFTVPEVNLTFSELGALAQASGVHVDFVPDPPEPRHAWEKATNLGARGRKTQAPPDMVRQCLADYGVEPTVKFKTVTVNGSAPNLVRHIVREAVISQAGRPEKQLSMDTVAVLTFDTDTNTADFREIRDPEGWVNGAVIGLLQDLTAKTQHLTNHPDGARIRYGIREALDIHYKVCLRGTGGVYYVPDLGNASDMQALRNYINGLDNYIDAVAVNRASCSLVTLIDDDNGREMLAQAEKALVEELRTELGKIYIKAHSIIGGKSKGKVREQVQNQAVEALDRITQTLKIFRENLDSDLEALDLDYQQTKDAVLDALTVG